MSFLCNALLILVQYSSNKMVSLQLKNVSVSEVSASLPQSLCLLVVFP